MGIFDGDFSHRNWDIAEFCRIAPKHWDERKNQIKSMTFESFDGGFASTTGNIVGI